MCSGMKPKTLRKRHSLSPGNEGYLFEVYEGLCVVSICRVLLIFHTAEPTITTEKCTSNSLLQRRSNVLHRKIKHQTKLKTT